jgi:hypothetical protein
MTNRMQWIAAGMFVVMLFVHASLLGQTTVEFGAADIDAQSDHVQNFLFGTVLRILGTFGAIGSIAHGIATSSFKPMLSYGAIGVCCAFIPAFINGVFNVSGMLLP